MLPVMLSGMESVLDESMSASMFLIVRLISATSRGTSNTCSSELSSLIDIFFPCLLLRVPSCCCCSFDHFNINVIGKFQGKNSKKQKENASPLGSPDLH